MIEHVLTEEKKNDRIVAPELVLSLGRLGGYRLGYVRSVSLHNKYISAFTLSSLACLLLVVYLFYSFIVPQTPTRLMRQSALLIAELPLWSSIASLPIPIPHSTQGVAVLLISFAVTAFSAYGLALYVAWKSQVNSTNLLIIAFAAMMFFSVSTWSLPNLNTDIYDYIIQGRIVTVYNDNPYYTPADRFPGDPIYPYASRQYTSLVADKLPAWMLVNVFLARVAGDTPVTNLLVYRSTFLLFNIANLTILGIILHKLKPESLLAGLVAYGWNPIVALYGQSKTDTVVVFFLLLGILLLTVGKRYTVIALALSVFVKLITLPLVAIYFVRELKLKGWRQFIINTFLFIITVIIIYAPFIEDAGLIFRHLSFLNVAGSSAPAAARPLLVLGFLFFIFLIGFIQDGSVKKLLNGWSLVMLFFSTFLAKLGFSHYLMTLIAIVSLTLNPPMVLITATLSFSSFLYNSWYTTSSSVFQLPELFTLPKFLVYLALPGIVTAYLAAALVWRRLLQRRVG